MTIVYSLLKGISRVLGNWRVIALLTLVQLVAAWLLAAPLGAELHARWDHSLAGEQLDAMPGMEISLWDEILITKQQQFEGVYNVTFIVIAGLCYLMFSLLVISGALPLYAGLDLKFSWDRFWANASRYFRPFVGLAIVAALLFLAADLGAEIMNSVLSDAVATSDDEPTIFFTSVLLAGAFRFMLFALIVLVFQYAKAIAAAEGLRNIIYLIRKALGFVARHFLSVLLLFAILGAIEISVTALDAGVWHFLMPDAEGWMAWSWVVVITALLVTIKLSFLACQLHLYNETLRHADEQGRIHLSIESYE